MTNKNFSILRQRYLESKAKKSQFKYFHRAMIASCELDNYKNPNWIGLEIGCGITPMKDHFKKVQASDIIETECCDFVVDATKLSSLSRRYDAIFAVNCFHHISNKKRFFIECQDILKDSGYLVILEPADTLLSKFIYPWLFKQEYYDQNLSIESLATEDPETGANQAASYICFKKYLSLFLSGTDFYHVNSRYCKNWLSFMLSGGTNFPTLAPYDLIKKLENKEILSKYLSLHWINTFKLRKM